MEWEIKIYYNQYLEVITTGIADNKSSQEMAKIIANSMRQNKLRRALIDHRNIDGVTGKATEIYERPNVFKLIGWILGIKIAEIINPEHIEHFQFFETVCINRGYRLMIFQEKEKALQWLLE